MVAHFKKDSASIIRHSGKKQDVVSLEILIMLFAV